MSEDDQASSFTCPFCGRAYTEQDRLTEHFDSRHDFNPQTDD